MNGHVDSITSGKIPSSLKSLRSGMRLARNIAIADGSAPFVVLPEIRTWRVHPWPVDFIS
jgi:hypothetical protein